MYLHQIPTGRVKLRSVDQSLESLSAAGPRLPATHSIVLTCPSVLQWLKLALLDQL